ncbi:hypothetical protein KKC13_01140 [bacterium]|nr:hypothetical protein [bacterium]
MNSYSYTFGSKVLDAKQAFPKIVKNELGWEEIDIPDFLQKYKWKPHHAFSYKDHTILIDFVYNDAYPHTIYKKEIPKILKKHKNISFCIFVNDETKYEDIQKLCEEKKYGLKWLCWIDITTVVPLNFEKEEETESTKIDYEDSWFPKLILDEIVKLKNLSYNKILINFATLYPKQDNITDELDLILKTIQELINSEKSFVANKKSFINLSHFEKLLKNNKVDFSEHTFHSFRVFLIGCIIIDNFYKLFIEQYKSFTPKISKFSIEYIWLLTALFHDIGYVKNKYEAFLDIETTEEFEQVISNLMSRKWSEKEEYKKARAHIVCLLSKLSSQKTIKTAFSGLGDYNTIPPYEKNKEVEEYLVMNYNKLKSHSVIGCFDLTAEVLKEIVSIKGDTDSVEGFLFHHLYVATLSICYHDWHLWEDLKRLGIFPLTFERYPFAALLIYIDTWDDHKRDEIRAIKIESFQKDENSFTVSLFWPDQRQYNKEKIKYKCFRDYVKFKKFELIIDVKNESQ